jgi:hypothetical protein
METRGIGALPDQVLEVLEVLLQPTLATPTTKNVNGIQLTSKMIPAPLVVTRPPTSRATNTRMPRQITSISREIDKLFLHHIIPSKAMQVHRIRSMIRAMTRTRIVDVDPLM